MNVYCLHYGAVVHRLSAPEKDVCNDCTFQKAILGTHDGERDVSACEKDNRVYIKPIRKYEETFFERMFGFGLHCEGFNTDVICYFDLSHCKKFVEE